MASEQGGTFLTPAGARLRSCQVTQDTPSGGSVLVSAHVQVTRSGREHRERERGRGLMDPPPRPVCCAVEHPRMGALTCGYSVP